MSLPYVQNVPIERLRSRSFSAPYFGFFLCLRGSARIILGSQSYRVNPGSLCLYTPNLFLQVLESSPDLDGICKVGSMSDYFHVTSILNARNQLRTRTAPCVFLSPDQMDAITRMNELIDLKLQMIQSTFRSTEGNDMIRELEEKSTLNLLISFCMEVLEAYFRNLPQEQTALSHRDKVFTQFLEDVYHFAHEEHMVSFYAQRQKFSAYYFSTLIRQVSGRTALMWIQDVLMHDARKLLENRPLGIKEIADRLGFQNQSLFGRFFRQHEGVSPAQWRRNL